MYPKSEESNLNIQNLTKIRFKTQKMFSKVFQVLINPFDKIFNFGDILLKRYNLSSIRQKITKLTLEIDSKN